MAGRWLDLFRRSSERATPGAHSGSADLKPKVAAKPAAAPQERGWLGKGRSLSAEKPAPRLFEHGLKSPADFEQLAPQAKAELLNKVAHAIEHEDGVEVPGFGMGGGNLDRRYIDDKDPAWVKVAQIWDGAAKEAGPYASLRVARQHYVEFADTRLARRLELMFIDQAGRRVERNSFILPDGSELPSTPKPRRSVENETALLHESAGPRIKRVRSGGSWEKQVSRKMEAMGDFFRWDSARMRFERAMEDKFRAKEPFTEPELDVLAGLQDKRAGDLARAREEKSGRGFYYAQKLTQMQEWTGTSDPAARTQLLRETLLEDVQALHDKALAVAGEPFNDLSPKGRQEGAKRVHDAMTNIGSLEGDLVTARMKYGLDIPAAAFRTAVAARDLLPRLEKLADYLAEPRPKEPVPFKEKVEDFARFNPEAFLEEYEAGKQPQATPELVAMAKDVRADYYLNRALNTLHTFASLMNPYHAAEARDVLATVDGLVAKRGARELPAFLAEKLPHLEEHRKRITQLSQERVGFGP